MHILFRVNISVTAINFKIFVLTSDVEQAYIQPHRLQSDIYTKPPPETGFPFMKDS